MRLLRDLTLGLYHPARSPVHRLDPRAKLAVCVLGMGASLLPGSALGAGAAWPLLLVGLAASRVPARVFFQGFRPFSWIFLFTMLLHALTTPGRELVGIAGTGWELTLEGLADGGAVAAQLATAVGYASLLTLTTSPSELVWALERLGRPLSRLGVPVGDFCVSAFLAMRFLPILRQEAERLGLALRARGVDPSAGGPRHRARALVPLVVPLFRQVLRRAEALALAMEVRGYPSAAKRTSWKTSGFRLNDTIALLFSFATLAGVLALGFR